MGRYIYQNPKECARALQLIMEQVDADTETANALKTAINYLGVMQMECEDREKKIAEEHERAQRLHDIKMYKRTPIIIGDVVKLKDEEDDDTALQWVVTRINENRVEGVCYDGAAYDDLEYDKLVKTGKNYSAQLSGLLTELCADMRGEE